METETSKKQQVLAKLHKRDVHFVLCRPSKAALETGWQRQAASLDSVLKHDAGGGLLGFIPGEAVFGFSMRTSSPARTKTPATC